MHFTDIQIGLFIGEGFTKGVILTHKIFNPMI